MPDYGYSKQLSIPFEDAVTKTITLLKEVGFGILTDIDVNKTLKEKLGIEFKSYRILGACSPKHAYQALEAEPNIGLLLPCNVIIYQEGNSVTVSAILPTVAMGMIDNKRLQTVATEVEKNLCQVIDRL